MNYFLINLVFFLKLLFTKDNAPTTTWSPIVTPLEITELGPI